ncbi:ImmA/IrrE family metallo-endopeptidase [Streptomyces hygroscopicus]|uniref:ImmA/IrrE family metallo-endopeptidase n=1 Tax=Streptomyces hygroscopicus TaxID=1912 RepID=UPI00131A8730|nr:hypothetical protein [Streptomyces hygroscopicus]
MDQLIETIPEAWRARARKIFAGRNLDGVANAEAWRDGEVGVIEINYGITSAAMIYSVLYCKYYEMVHTLGNDVDFTDDDQEALLMILEEVGDSGFTPILVADRERESWLSDRSVFAGHELLRELPTSRSEEDYHNVVRSIEEFVLAHELAHHLLGHTVDAYPRSRQNEIYLDSVMRKYGIELPDEELNDDQLQEMKADILALLMTTGALLDEATAPRVYRALAGSVIGLTALAHIYDTWVVSDSSGETHPDFLTRFSCAAQVITCISKRIPVGSEGGHPIGFMNQLSGFVSIILNNWLAKHLEDRQPVNVLGLTSWLFEQSQEVEKELERLGLRTS